jgi:hypothetical protein
MSAKWRQLTARQDSIQTACTSTAQLQGGPFVRSSSQHPTRTWCNKHTDDLSFALTVYVCNACIMYHAFLVPSYSSPEYRKGQRSILNRNTALTVVQEQNHSPHPKTAVTPTAKNQVAENKNSLLLERYPSTSSKQVYIIQTSGMAFCTLLDSFTATTNRQV